MFENQITQSIEAGAPDITYSGNEATISFADKVDSIYGDLILLGR